MKIYFLVILNFLKNNKDGIEILISIFQNLGIFILFLFGGFLSYLAIFREIKFARIKELHKQQNEIMLKFLIYNKYRLRRILKLLKINVTYFIYFLI
ncbi:hypothetical protein LBK6_11540 [Leptospira borgpetersenii serovar Hardjo]|nr:hypothetical protein LBK6_11540 [Leptospira borgpetersenii serovar Hardjo]AWV70731.1 hypothetical protein B9T54_12460 [Leptospira borgpetersenii serovar Hardjo-bovis]TQE50761.1 hypothetical protein FFZ95_17370 [Leptospira borgpetersenii]AMX62200.1 hypothetical protein LBK9_11590 [Leptospira borgpetersenii serovar Hardjo]AMX65443.1 hypothetical protein LBK30_11610 [Leptospira borgpetersenii serovar Hardjo]